MGRGKGGEGEREGERRERTQERGSIPLLSSPPFSLSLFCLFSSVYAYNGAL